MHGILLIFAILKDYVGCDFIPEPERIRSTKICLLYYCQSVPPNSQADRLVQRYMIWDYRRFASHPGFCRQNYKGTRFVLSIPCHGLFSPINSTYFCTWKRNPKFCKGKNNVLTASHSFDHRPHCPTETSPLPAHHTVARSFTTTSVCNRI